MLINEVNNELGSEYSSNMSASSNRSIKKLAQYKSFKIQSLKKLNIWKTLAS